MSWIAAAVSIGSALIGANASSGAADTQSAASDRASQVQLEMFNKTQANLAPWLTAGQSSLSQLTAGTQPGGQFQPTAYADYKPFTLDQFSQDPGYQFQKQQGEAALTNQQSVTGGPNSNNLKGLVSFSQGLASTDYQQALNNYIQQFQLGNQQTGLNNQNRQQQFSNTASIASGGLAAATGQGNISAGVGQSVGSNIIGAGNAQAAGQVGVANAVTGAGSSGYNNYLQQQYLNAYTNSRNGTNSNTPLVAEALPGQYSTVNEQYGG